MRVGTTKIDELKNSNTAEKFWAYIAHQSMHFKRGLYVNRVRKKIARNLSGYGYSQAITIASQILIVPFFLSAWGVLQYGEWLVLTSIPMFLAMLELGVAEASATRASLAAGCKDNDAVRRTIDTAMAFSVATAFSVVLLGSFLAAYIPWSSYLKLTGIDLKEARDIFICMSFYLAGNFLAGPISAWLKAMDRTALSAFFMANRRAAEMAVTAIALCLGATPVTLAFCLMITSAVTVLIYYSIALRHSNIGAMSLRYASKQELRSVIFPAISYMALPLAQVVTLQGGLIILNTLAGGIAVAAFSMARTMVRLLMQVGIVFNNAMRPEVSRLLGQKQSKAAISIVKNGSLIAGLIAFIGICGIAILGRQILDIWSDGKVLLQPAFLVLLAVHAAVNVLWYVPSTILFAQNRHGKISWFYMIFSVVSLTMWWLNSSRLDPLSGAALMMLTPEILMCGTLIILLLSNTKKNHAITNQETTLSKRIT